MRFGQVEPSVWDPDTDEEEECVGWSPFLEFSVGSSTELQFWRRGGWGALGLGAGAQVLKKLVILELILACILVT
jgi:hypothetical protein